MNYYWTPAYKFMSINYVFFRMNSIKTLMKQLSRLGLREVKEDIALPRIKVSPQKSVLETTNVACKYEGSCINFKSLFQLRVYAIYTLIMDGKHDHTLVTQSNLERDNALFREKYDRDCPSLADLSVLIEELKLMKNHKEITPNHEEILINENKDKSKMPYFIRSCWHKFITLLKILGLNKKTKPDSLYSKIHKQCKSATN